MFSSKKILFLIFILLSSALYSTIINVPADQPTIQEAIDISVDADTVLVQPGVYYENINYNGKLITIGSLFLTTQDTTYIASTIIDGSSNERVVIFWSGEDATTVLSGFTITNGSSSYGAGIYCNQSSPTLKYLIVTGNSVSICGGGISCYYANPNIENITISGNYAFSKGGGIYCDAAGPSLENVTITDNTVNWEGGGIYFDNSNSTLENVTLADNTAGGDGGGLYLSGGSAINLLNCIMWNDTQPEIYSNVNWNTNSITIAYSDIEGGEAGIVTNDNLTVNWMDGNVDTDPLFVDAGNGDYYLQSTSPCIDAGDPSSPLDPDGTAADMGAWFYNQGSAIEDNEIENVKLNISNYPNPFNPLTTIQFDIKENEIGVLKIFNIKGQLLESHQFETGEHDFQWDASSMSSGVYLYQLQTENNTVSKKMLLLK